VAGGAVFTESISTTRLT